MHLDMPTRRDIARLAAARNPHSVSVYMPTSLETQETDKNRLTARALFEAATERVAQTADKRELGALREHLDDFLDDTEFWHETGRSLAVFATPNAAIEFRLPNLLGEHWSVSDRFAITPLLRAVTFPQAAFVLALSQNAVRLVEINADLPPHLIHGTGMPPGAAEVPGLRGFGSRAPYGRIQGDEGRKVRLTQYARAVDHAIRPVVNGAGLPLILAATEPIASIYRHLCGYSGLADETIAGNPDELTEGQLAEAARGVLDGIYRDELKQLTERYDQFSNAGRATSDLGELARAATQGAIDTLAVDMDAQVPGSIDDAGTLHLNDGDPDVIEEIARRALATDARVLSIRRGDLPLDVEAAAILRYAV